jgi:type II secretory pathway predicted ATPase ExeA
MKNFEHDFNLPPFPGFPSASRYVPSGPVADTLPRVTRSVLAREAISLVIGPPGTGKSLVCALLAKQFADSHDVVSLGQTSLTDETTIYRYVLNRLGVVVQAAQRDNLEMLVQEHLCGEDANPNGVVLIIDEASSLSVEVLEALRRLTNIMRDGQPMVSIVAAGGVNLDETLTAPSLESFVQRVTARCYLHPLNLEETRQYIHRSIEACDASPEETITDVSISAIYHATCGVPRLINQLMTEAIDCAAELDESLIDEHTINKAWASLQQLPGPMMDEPTTQPESSTVEFGELIDSKTMDSNPVADAEGVPRIATPPLVDQEWAAEADVDTGPERANDCMQQEAVADTCSLFGDFEDEEKIEVGAAEIRRLPSHRGEVDLESMLHSEIVSLSQFAAENTLSRFPESDARPSQHSGFEEELVSNVDAASDADADTPSVIWYDEPVQVENPSVEEEQPTTDDTDLLWITDDIDVERRHVSPSDTITPHRVDKPGQDEVPKLKVDYREMLERMRKQSQ